MAGRYRRRARRLLDYLRSERRTLRQGFVALVRYGMGLENPIAFNAATVVGIGVATLFRLYSYRKFVFLATPSGAALEQLEPEAAS